MAPVKEISRDALRLRRQEILDRLQLDRDAFQLRIAAATLTPEEWGAREELESIDFLLNEDA